LLLAEFALGTLTGQERARVLEHVGACEECRRDLAALSEVGDELLLLAPRAEPPVGFESRVFERVATLGESRRRMHSRWLKRRGAQRPRSRRWMVLVAAALVGGLIGAAVTFVAESEDRTLADSYRETLAVAQGQYFAARQLVDAAGSPVGHVFGYQGSPSWVFFVVRRGPKKATYEVEMTTRSGRTWSAGELYVSDGRGSMGLALAVDLRSIKQILFVNRATGQMLWSNWL
jgi:hypothetical protein